MEKFLREWRQDALNKAQYDSAIFIGDKLLALTNDDNDAFWLAQVHFATGNYTRAQAFLSKQDLIARNPSCRYLAGHCLIKQSRFDEALAVLGERNPTHLIRNSSTKVKTTHNGVGRVKRAAGHGDEGSSEDDASNRRFEAAMCFLRGICYAKQNAFDRAKECYKDAVSIDVQCFEAFQQLMKNNLMSPDEEWQFLDGLDFDSITVASGAPGSAPDAALSQEAAEFARMLYTTRLSKYRNPATFTAAADSLSTHYGLADNADLLLARADLLYTQCRFRDALAITDSVLAEDKYNFSAYPLHLACLYELRMKNVLFLVAHDLADSHPEEPCAWLAVGVYYFVIDRVAEARRYFSKASMMDAHFGPAWIGFAHTFAAEGEHDQAISAYSTAARLFMGTHLPQVFLGMQNHALNNMTLAEEFLKTAYGLCRSDPLLLNEMGVVKYHQDRSEEAARMFRGALRVADDIDSDPLAWLAARTNLGHAYRRQGQLDKALQEFDEVLKRGGADANVFCARGLIYMMQDQPRAAVAELHRALALNAQDPIATELLGKALDEAAALDVEELELGAEGAVEGAAAAAGVAGEDADGAERHRRGAPPGRRYVGGVDDDEPDDPDDADGAAGTNPLDAQVERRIAQARAESRRLLARKYAAAAAAKGDKGKGVDAGGGLAGAATARWRRAQGRGVGGGGGDGGVLGDVEDDANVDDPGEEVDLDRDGDTKGNNGGDSVMDITDEE